MAVAHPSHSSLPDPKAQGPGLKITFVLPGRGRSGGVRVTVEMANRLLKRGHAVRIAWRRAPLTSYEGLRNTAKRFALHLNRFNHHDWLQDFRGLAEPFQNLSSLRFSRNEVVIAVGTMTIEDVFNLPGSVLKVRYCHGISENQPELTRRAWGLPMPTICVSKTLAPVLKDLTGVEPLTVIPNGINATEYFEEDRERLGVGAIYSRHHLKAPETLLEILRRLRESRPDTPCLLFGETAKPSRLPGVSYMRLPSVSKAREIYNRCKIWLLPSLSEGLPAPVLEAMACGCAVISTRQRGSLEVIRDGKNGLLVPVGDVKAFLDKIQLLLRDEAYRQALVESGRQTVAQFSWDVSVGQMEDCLHGLAAGIRTSPSTPSESAARS